MNKEKSESGKKVSFFKMSACGNDFVVIDNRQNTIEANQCSKFVQKVCQRRISLGADGVIFLHESNKADFQMRFFNADGQEVEMCGNGARCLARFAYLNRISSHKMIFKTRAGLIEAEVMDHQVKLKMDYRLTPSAPFSLDLNGAKETLSFLTAGVPHVVLMVEDLERVNVVTRGREIRFHPHFQPNGTNANFASIENPHRINLRTYERGVEDETLACGTGAIATSIICAHQGKVASPVLVKTRSGCNLKIYFEKREDTFENIFLQGEARVVAEGCLWEKELSILSAEREENKYKHK